ncbi:hypothetical protein EWM64_g1397 [Hericium alpestre]|uniref:Uncharacterized protein n=1 Tax=Hericium alpestre TaxID=135208 RepID=A0A4Z0A9L3_9AGAM|nr:hypothetical protein EWM64_g1397 [Hericium alpestre]
MTPITPFFARPAKVEQQRDVRWGPKPIMRSDSEETLIPRSRPGGKGDDFWRRFSMIAKEENQKPSSQKQSVWLRKNMDGTTRLSRWVWIVTVLLLACIGMAIGLGWYASHTHPNTPHSAPKTFGGSANEHGAVAKAPEAVDADGSTSHHVSPTNTVARRYDIPDPVPTFEAFNVVPLPHAPSGLDGVHRAAPNRRHRRHAHLNRTTY